jgi:hypothetical protein
MRFTNHPTTLPRDAAAFNKIHDIIPPNCGQDRENKQDQGTLSPETPARAPQAFGLL